MILTDATPGATIYYAINGRPTTSSAVYTRPIVLNNSGTFTVEAIAALSGHANSAVATATYTIHPNLARPVFSPPAVSYTTPQTVTLSDVSRGTNFYYTTDGSTPTTSSTLYAGPITVSANEIINAIGVLSGFTNSPVTSASYIIERQVPTPTIGPALGTHTSTTVTITDTLAGATIYYTLDGVTPTTSFPVYKEPILLNGAGSYNVRAIAVANGYINSAVASAAYTIRPVLARPVFSPPAGSYTTAQNVTISDVSRGTTFYYTTDGSTPTTSSTLYTGPITVSASEPIKVIGVLSGLVNSPVVSARYTIGP